MAIRKFSGVYFKATIRIQPFLKKKEERNRILSYSVIMMLSVFYFTDQ